MHSPEKLRAYELSKNIGVSINDLISEAKSIGIDIKSHMTILDYEKIKLLEWHYKTKDNK